MAATCILLFAPSSSTTQDTLEALLSALYPSRVIDTKKWSLTHTAYRAVLAPSAVNGIAVARQQASTTEPAHLHVLTRSSSPANAYIHTYTPIVSTNGAKAKDATATIVVPAAPDKASFSDLLNRKLVPLWSTVKQLDLHVSNGVAYTVGTFRVLLGEVRSMAQTGQGVKAILLSVSLLEEPDVGLQETTRGGVSEIETVLIREFLSSLRVQEDASEVFWGRELPQDVELWCQALRSRTFRTPGRTINTAGAGSSTTKR